MVSTAFTDLRTLRRLTWTASVDLLTLLTLLDCGYMVPTAFTDPRTFRRLARTAPADFPTPSALLGFWFTRGYLFLLVSLAFTLVINNLYPFPGL
jgi:hypothetical protein